MSKYLKGTKYWWSSSRKAYIIDAAIKNNALTLGYNPKNNRKDRAPNSHICSVGFRINNVNVDGVVGYGLLNEEK